MNVSFIIKCKEVIETKIIFLLAILLPIKLAILLLEYVEIALEIA